MPSACSGTSLLGTSSGATRGDALGIPLDGSGRAFALSFIGDIVETTGGYHDSLQSVAAYLARSVATARSRRTLLRGRS